MADRPTIRLHLMHASMQFNDSPTQKRADAQTIFQRAVDRDVSWITGTEVLERSTRGILEEAAREYGYRFAVNRGFNDTFVAVRRKLIAGDWDTYWEPTMEAGEGKGDHGPRGVWAVEFDTTPKGLGHCTVIAGHLVRKFDGHVGNRLLNEELAAAIGRYAREQGEGPDLVFYGGDHQNAVDAAGDPFLGQAALTPASVELGKPPGIDFIASYNHDRRVTAVYSRRLNDDQVPLHTDHQLVEAGFDVTALRVAG